MVLLPAVCSVGAVMSCVALFVEPSGGSSEGILFGKKHSVHGGGAVKPNTRREQGGRGGCKGAGGRGACSLVPPTSSGPISGPPGSQLPVKEDYRPSSTPAPLPTSCTVTPAAASIGAVVNISLSPANGYRKGCQTPTGTDLRGVAEPAERA